MWQIEDAHVDSGNRVYELNGFSGSPVWSLEANEKTIVGLFTSGVGRSVYRGKVHALKMEKVIRYRMPDDRKRSLGAGIIIRKILDENGLTESCLRYSDNEKPVVDGLFFNVSHAGDYVVGVLSDCEVGCDIEKNANAPLEVAEHYFYHSELAYIKAAKNKDKAFFTLWTLKESYMKMTGRGMSLPLDSFEVVPTADGFVLGKSSERPCFFETMEFDGYIFSVSSERAFSLHNPLEIAFDDIYI